MRLNQTLGELNNNFEEYGEWLYWITVMGTPADKEPWGWQLDGHPPIINYFVLGDQVVATPTFMAPNRECPSGTYTGTTVLQDEQNREFELINALNEAQRQKAIIEISKTATRTWVKRSRITSSPTTPASAPRLDGHAARAVARCDRAYGQDTRRARR